MMGEQRFVFGPCVRAVAVDLRVPLSRNTTWSSCALYIYIRDSFCCWPSLTFAARRSSYVVYTRGVVERMNLMTRPTGFARNPCVASASLVALYNSTLISWCLMRQSKNVCAFCFIFFFFFSFFIRVALVLGLCRATGRPRASSDQAEDVKDQQAVEER